MTKAQKKAARSASAKKGWETRIARERREIEAANVREEPNSDFLAGWASAHPVDPDISPKRRRYRLVYGPLHLAHLRAAASRLPVSAVAADYAVSIAPDLLSNVRRLPNFLDMAVGDIGSPMYNAVGLCDEFIFFIDAIQPSGEWMIEEAKGMHSPPPPPTLWQRITGWFR